MKRTLLLLLLLTSCATISKTAKWTKGNRGVASMDENQKNGLDPLRAVSCQSNYTKSALDSALIARFQEAMDASKIPLPEQERFWPLLARYVAGDRGFVKWEELSKLKVGDPELISYSSALSQLRSENRQNLADVAVVKLNGGLGTSMGLSGPKTLLPVKGRDNFLSIILGQLRAAQKKSVGLSLPLVLMNSFNTESETIEELKKLNPPQQEDSLRILNMNQGIFLRIQTAETRSGSEHQIPLQPLNEQVGEERFNPPGHGDVYRTLKDSGILEKLRKQGKKFLFISNADNLGATPDPGIVGYMRENKIPFLMEVTERSANDVKGGTVSKISGSSRLKLLELANVPEVHQLDFQDIQQFPVFNTNNIWVDLEALETQLDSNSLTMDLIVNPKKVGAASVVQLEQAMGSAISSFPGAVAMVVPRSRFRPVKSTNELFLLRSSLFEYGAGEFRYTLPSSHELPVIQLGSAFKKIGDFEKRIPQIPEISKLKKLHVEGNVFFGSNLVLEGEVVIKAGEAPMRIPSGAKIKAGEYSCPHDGVCEPVKD